MKKFNRKDNSKLFDAKYLPDGNKIVNEWFIRTQQNALSWPENKHNSLINFTRDTDDKFNNMSKDKEIVNRYKSALKYDIYEYLRNFNDKGFEQLVAYKDQPWSLEKSIEHGLKQSIQTLVNQALNKFTYYSINSRNSSGKLLGYGTRGGGKCFGKLCPSQGLKTQKLLNEKT